jgi:hypothetical protein
MNRTIQSNKKQFTLGIELASSGVAKVKIEAQDAKKPSTYFYRQEFEVKGNRKFKIPFPQSPNELLFKVYPANFKSYNHYLQFGRTAPKNFTILKTDILPLETKPIWLSDDDREFIKFAQNFAENAGIYSAIHPDGTPSIYRSGKGKFTIDYYDKIRDNNGNELNTPARIGHVTGNIEVSQSDFLKYTIPMRMIILLHEYCHKWRNPKTGLKIEDESGADINGLQIYLSLGYSPVEAHQAFLDVFYGARNEANRARYLIIDDFVYKFENGQLGQYYKTSNVAKR